MARPEGGETGCLGAPPAVGANCTEAVGGGLAYPLHAASPHGVLRPHTLGTEFIRHVIKESIGVWYAHAKARATLGSTMVWVLQELRLHQQAEREGVQPELLGCRLSPGG